MKKPRAPRKPLTTTGADRPLDAPLKWFRRETEQGEVFVAPSRWKDGYEYRVYRITEKPKRYAAWFVCNSVMYGNEATPGEDYPPRLVVNEEKVLTSRQLAQDGCDQMERLLLITQLMQTVVRVRLCYE